MKVEIVEDFVENLHPTDEPQDEIKDLLKQIQQNQRPISENAPQHQVYSDNFNALDLANKGWYLIAYPHPVFFWTSRLMHYMLRYGVTNAWVITEMMQAQSLANFRDEAVMSVLKREEF